MANRKKRLEKGIESLEKQIVLHKEKKKVAQEEGKIELGEYYEKELKVLESVKEVKEKILRK